MQNYDRTRWMAHLFRGRGTALAKVAPHLLFVLVIALVIVGATKRGFLTGSPLGVHALLGTVLGLVLAFRTNTGYDRFWEGRKAWGAIVNHARNIGRMLATATTIGDDTRLRMATLVAAFAWAARRDLGHIERHQELDRLLGKERADTLEQSPGPPQRVLLKLGAEIESLRREGALDAIDHARFEGDLLGFIESLGVCHRIQNTPIPFAYAVFLRRVLLLYTTTLAFPLAPLLGWYSISAIAFIAYTLFGLEQIGVEIEDPFEEGPNDLDLFGICTNIERDVMAQLDAVNSPQSQTTSARTT